MNPWKYLATAASCAVASTGLDRRTFRLGAVGIRSDGVIVKSRNESGMNVRCPPSHAEARVTRKLDGRSTVFVARVLRDGGFALAHPCKDCLRVMRSRGVSKVFFTIDNDTFGRIVLSD